MIIISLGGQCLLGIAPAHSESFSIKGEYAERILKVIFVYLEWLSLKNEHMTSSSLRKSVQNIRIQAQRIVFVCFLRLSKYFIQSFGFSDLHLLNSYPCVEEEEKVSFQLCILRNGLENIT